MSRPRYLRQRTKVVCTIGPATASAKVLKQLLKAGMSIARFNLSHGTHQEHSNHITILRKAADQLGIPVAILIDLPGPKYRIGSLQEGSVPLERGAQVILSTQPTAGELGVLPVNLPTFLQDIRVGDSVLLGDGAIQLKIQAISGADVNCKVLVGGTVTSRQGIAVPGMRTSAPFVTQQLKDDLTFAVEQEPDYLALSFVSDASDISQVKAILQNGNTSIPLIAKIEQAAAVANFDKVLATSEGVMVARGDLGVDIPLERVPLVQKEIIKKCNKAGKPVITATQMLESMINAARPTRAEVSDVANAILDGTDAVMLSAETAIGKYPALAVEMMSRIAKETEAKLPYEHLLREEGALLKPQTDEAISYDACYTAHRLGAVAIVAFTESGSTAQRVSKYRPRVPILAITPDERIRRRLLLYWGVHAFSIAEPTSVDELFVQGARLPKELGLAKTGDLVVITGGVPIGVAGTTNLLKVETVA